jgi:Ca-activated chloride channel family protein
MRGRGVLLAGVFVTLVVCVVVKVASQSRAGTIRGVVTDPAGAVVVGANVTLTRAAATVTTALTDMKGEFVFADLPAGVYEVTVSLAGFRKATMPVNVRTGAAEQISFALQIGRLEDTVVLSPPGELEAANRDDARVSQLTSVFGRSVREATAFLGAPPPPAAPRPFNTESYDKIDDNQWTTVAHKPLSTFSIDVDTASYANVRRFLNGGRLPPKDAVRVEELVNYFSFDYPQP